jgi:pimeloyl-ACP methyl ester carboxylesterase
MHGENDPRAKLSEGRRVYDAVPGAKKFKIFAEAGHQSYAKAYPEQWMAEIRLFLSENICANP